MTNDTKRTVYNVSVSFWVPMEGMVPIAALDEEDAKSIAIKMFEKRKDVVIVDCYDLEDVEGMDEEDLLVIKENVVN